jgi:hypothetical protein
MPILCNDLDGNVAAIVAEWKAATNRPPWNALTESQWVDHLPPLLHAMIEGVLCAGGSHEARRSVIEQATIHGQHRRSSGLPLEIILDEAAELRAATWRFLTGRVDSVADSEVLAEIVRFDAAVTVATIASFAGFHRAEHERTRTWKETVDALVTDWEDASLMDRPR